MTEILLSLRRILDDAISTVVSVCESRNEDFPRLDDPADPSEYSLQGIRNNPEVAHAIKLGVAAASQLISTLQSPIQAAATLGFLANIPANIAAVERLHVPEILRKSGEAGMHVSEIAQYNGTSADKLERILRHLATHHIFREVSPGVFAHNKISSILDTGKDYETIIQDPEKKFDNTNGLCALASLLTDELSKAYPYTADILADASVANSQEVNNTTLQKALNMNYTLWQYLDLPENAFRNRRFNIAMRGTSSLQPPSKIVHLYDWKALPEQAIIVDVGSGLGHVSLDIAAIRPDITFVLEDRPSVVAQAKELHFWTSVFTSYPELMHQTMSGLDYLSPQPQLPSPPDVFLLRYILHNQPDKYAVMLLKHLREAAGASTKLIILDFIVAYACPVSGEAGYYTMPGDIPAIAPFPLLPNFGVAGAYPYNTDMVMLSYLNAKERTIGAWRSILDISGWKLGSVRQDQTNRSGWSVIIAEIA
ncbi:S-adenosyl-L-methionine-dependent methyltransferase [Irpex lacteus]|nr:S-adenosyl-L-methionine-dependent methyltransferase [Irpex lacteus]